MATPGIHPLVKLNHYTNNEQKIIKNLSKEWYITNGGRKLNLGINSQYKYFLMRPTKAYHEMFNLDRDLIVLFSNYEDFQARTLNNFDLIPSFYEKFRVEKICGVLISRDPKVEEKIKNILKNEQETSVVVPFYFNELLDYSDDFLLRNRFKKYFYTRDLFAFESPLKKDIFFFGRNDLIHNIVNRHLSGENSGLFGLRKTGKTSVIFGIRRTLDKSHSNSVFIDCQNPSFHRRRWFQALEYIVDEILKQFDLSKVIIKGEDYSEINAGKLFEDDILKVHSKLGKKSFLIIFDEIENITFNVSPSEHWCKGSDFIFFWQAIRSVFQKLQHVYTYLIVGTNPLCVETSTINGKDNPIFSQLPFQYIPRFDVPQTTEMLKKLGSIMGIFFDEILYGMISEDFGGHPFLIRHVCSILNRVAPSSRPLHVDKGLYEHAKKIFMKEHTKYFDMILNVFGEHFKEEFEMLKYLARGDNETFKELALISPEFTNHLIGYGIIEFKNSNYSFRNDSVKEYLAAKEKFRKLSQTKEEMLNEISERRNSIEVKIRKIIKIQLHANYGKIKAFENFLKLIPSNRREKMSVLAYDELFNANISEIYFEDLRIIITKNWDIFKNVFSISKEELDSNLSVINKYRNDAHAKNIDKDEMQNFRISISLVEKQISDFWE